MTMKGVGIMRGAVLVLVLVLLSGWTTRSYAEETIQRTFVNLGIIHVPN